MTAPEIPAGEEWEREAGRSLADRPFSLENDGEWIYDLAGTRQIMLSKGLLLARVTIELGSKELVHNMRAEARAEVMGARLVFFEHGLQLADQAHPLHKSYEEFKGGAPSLVPIDTFIEAQRELAAHDIPASKVLRQDAGAFRWTATGIRESVVRLEDRRLKPGKIFTTAPEAVYLSGQMLDEKMAVFTNRGIRGSRAINTTPALLKQGADTLDAKLDLLESEGIDIRIALTKRPGILQQSRATIRAKIELVKQLHRVFGWRGEVSSALTHSPILLTASSNRLLTLARLVADHSNPAWRNMAPSAIASIVGRPLECVVAAAATGYFTPTSIAAQHRKLNTASARREQVLVLLDDSDSRQQIGRLSARAYVRHAPVTKTEWQKYPDLENKVLSMV